MDSTQIRLLSTDFDGTLHSDHEDPPIAVPVQDLIAKLQSQGVKWAINTGRDLPSLMEALGRARLCILPDYLVTIEREIYFLQRDGEGYDYVPHELWNHECTRLHDQLFAHVRKDLQPLHNWVHQNFTATIYEDPWSPFCLLARNSRDTDQIHQFLEEYARTVPDLAVVRNDVYVRFCHARYNKGSALKEIRGLLGIEVKEVLAAGDHWNDLPMLDRHHAHWLVAPSNAIPEVQRQVLRFEGYLSALPCGRGVAEGIEHCMRLVATRTVNST